MHKFTDKMPAGNFYWLFNNKDGTRSAYWTDIKELDRYVALYGRPDTTVWTDSVDGMDVASVYGGIHD